MRRLSRLPLRVRLTLGFAGAAAVLLAIASTAIIVIVKHGLDASLDSNLGSRAGYLSKLARNGDEAGLRRALSTDSEPAQVLTATGRVLDASPVAGETSLVAGKRLAIARVHDIAFERAERVRLVARPIAGGRVVVVATSMIQRERALTLLRAVVLIGSPLILLLASGAGYLVAAGALRPVEQMRRRAAEISTATTEARLPLPDAEDELHRLGVTLNQMLERLEISAAGERAFLASASHELRTPLAILKAEVDLALTGEQDPSTLAAALQSAGEEADRLIRLADDLLVVARGQQGRLPLSVADVPVDDLFDELVNGYATLGVDRVDSRASPDLHLVADRLRLQQALGNLIDNARRHGAPPVQLSAREVPDGIELHVTDHGEGFPAAALSAPLDGTPRTSARGFGLGLAMVASIAQAHGGSATITNTDDGADAWITLPRASSVTIPLAHDGPLLDTVAPAAPQRQHEQRDHQANHANDHQDRPGRVDAEAAHISVHGEPQDRANGDEENGGTGLHR